MDIVWSDRARTRIGEILAYHKARSRTVAARILGDLEKATEMLKTFPHMGAKESVLPGGAYRFLLVRNRYKIVYRVDEQTGTVRIVTVWDCRMDPSKIRGEME